MPTYLVFGLCLHASQPLPGLHAVIPSSLMEWGCDVIVECQPNWSFASLSYPKELVYISSECMENHQPALQVWKLAGGVCYRFAYADSVEFVVSGSGDRIEIDWSPSLGLADAMPYLLGPVLAFVLRLRGVVSLHASALAVDGRALVLMGPMGAGKSTTAAALARCGFPVLSDDVVTLIDHDGGFLVQPGYPGLRLWPDMVEAMFGDDSHLPQIVPIWDKRLLSLTSSQYSFQEQPLPVGAIYLLGERSDNDDAPLTAQLSARDTLLQLLANSYVTYLLDRTMRMHEFDLLNRLLQRCTLVRRVVAHTDPSLLPRLCETIVADFRKRAQANVGSPTR